MSDRKLLLGARIKELRKRTGLSQDQLAERVGIEAKYLSRIEVGKRYPSLETLESIADALRVEMRELFNFTHFEDGADTTRGFQALIEGATSEELRLINKIVTAILR
ncbi:Helix-turn-helix motif [Citrifermentans bremense]|uniref:Helix-turn-helix motif n=1 Tax=Citrifermentans bremense TaxID=60035 RepID=A0A6S6M0G6_9BACT|nr:helix-turn-helix transcriptional regulator [Citrifermentans bremense]BCG45666.1 Helix-turn-helix motif [Citrifermentans bremense]